MRLYFLLVVAIFVVILTQDADGKSAEATAIKKSGDAARKEKKETKSKMADGSADQHQKLTEKSHQRVTAGEQDAAIGTIGNLGKQDSNDDAAVERRKYRGHRIRNKNKYRNRRSRRHGKYRSSYKKKNYGHHYYLKKILDPDGDMVQDEAILDNIITLDADDDLPKKRKKKDVKYEDSDDSCSDDDDDDK